MNKKVLSIFMGLILCTIAGNVHAKVFMAEDGSGTYVGGLPFVSNYQAYAKGTSSMSANGIYHDGKGQMHTSVHQKMDSIRVLLNRLRKHTRQNK